MSGLHIIRDLFGHYELYDKPDYENFTGTFFYLEKWAVYYSGCLSAFEVLFGKNPPKTFLPIAKTVLKFVGPAAVGAGAFAGTLYASANLRGKKDDEWNSLNATIVSSAAVYTVRRSAPAVLMYFMVVGLTSNIWKQFRLYNWTLLDMEKQRKIRKTGTIDKEWLFDWTLIKERPPKWINADDLKRDH